MSLYFERLAGLPALDSGRPLSSRLYTKHRRSGQPPQESSVSWPRSRYKFKGPLKEEQHVTPFQSFIVRLPPGELPPFALLGKGAAEAYCVHGAGAMAMGFANKTKPCVLLHGGDKLVQRHATSPSGRESAVDLHLRMPRVQRTRVKLTAFDRFRRLGSVRTWRQPG